MLLDAKGFFARISEAMGTDSAPEIARKLGISKNAVYFWVKGQMPGLKGLKNVLKVAETTNTSLTWLLTGTGAKTLGVHDAAPDSEIHAALVAFAKRQKLDPAAVVNEAIREYLASRGVLEDPSRRVNVVFYRDTNMVPVMVFGEISRKGPIQKYQDLVMERVAAEFKTIERQARAVRVADDSFAPEFRRGDLIVYSQYIEPANGSTVIAAIGKRETVVGLFYREGSDVVIRTAGAETPALRVRSNKVTILGVVIGVHRRTSATETLNGEP